MPYYDRIPKEGEKVWVEHRIKQGRQPNGYVYSVIWEGHECMVKYHDSPMEDFDIFSWAELEAAYCPEMFNGIYMFYERT